MPLVLPAQQYHNPPHLPTPASYNFQAGGLGWRNRSSEVTPSRKTGGWTVSLRDGLPTPPSDMTGVSFNTSVASNYAMKKPHNNVYNHTTYPSISTLFHTGKTNSLAQAAKSNPLFSAPESTRSREMEDQKQKTNSSIATYLQIPSSINNSKGSLAEFAAQITCLFWFEKSSKVDAIEALTNSGGSVPALVPEAIPTMGFRKWVTTILSTTQVSQNVILLALLFISRLKKFNPSVRGKKGSEFRLMTIALMMGNKFLDDNTYTNKTWAEVSGISVQEIHIMEVEFLSNVRYNLFASKEDWRKWHAKLAMFDDYFHRASRMPLETGYDERTPITPTLQISPNMFPLSPGTQLLPPSPSTKLPSPPLPTAYDAHQYQYPAIPYPQQSPSRQLRKVDVLPANRKRSWDSQSEEHPPKKMARSNSPTSNASMPSLSNGNSSHAYRTQLPNLGPGSVPPLSIPVVATPVPRLPIPQYPVASNSMAPTTHAPSSQLPLPGHAIPTSYPPSTTWPQQVPASTSLAPMPMNVHSNPMPLSDSRRQSPLRITSTNVSPSVSTYSARTPQNRLSPSFFLTDRYSPYRPVRSVNTLLIPPPSGSVHNPRNLSFNQMHYQPLGKAVSERKTGVLPYLHHDAWPQQSQQPQQPPQLLQPPHPDLNGNGGFLP